MRPHSMFELEEEWLSILNYKIQYAIYGCEQKWGQGEYYGKPTTTPFGLGQAFNQSVSISAGGSLNAS